MKKVTLSPALVAMAVLSGSQALAEPVAFKGIALALSKSEVIALHKLNCSTKNMTLYDEVCRLPAKTTYAEVPMKLVVVNFIGNLVNSINAEFDRGRYATVAAALAEKYGSTSCQSGRFPRCSWTNLDGSFILLQKWDESSSLTFDARRDSAVIEERSKAIESRKKKDM